MSAGHHSFVSSSPSASPSSPSSQSSVIITAIRSARGDGIIIIRGQPNTLASSIPFHPLAVYLVASRALAVITHYLKRRCGKAPIAMMMMIMMRSNKRAGWLRTKVKLCYMGVQHIGGGRVVAPMNIASREIYESHKPIKTLQSKWRAWGIIYLPTRRRKWLGIRSHLNNGSRQSSTCI